MYASSDNPAPSRSVLMRFLVRSREYRHPRHWVRVRVACGAFNVVLMSALATVAAFAYNITVGLIGGLDVTLAERE